MKKILSIFIIYMLIITSFGSVQVLGQDFEVERGFSINFNGEATEYLSVISNNKHYLPMRKVFELMGSKVFFRNSDNKILVLSRDGDIITHIIGENIIIVNGMEKIFENPSFTVSDETYISVDMVAVALCPDRIFYQNQQLNIEKYIFTNDYHKTIGDVLGFAEDSNFYPERFKRYLDFHAKYPNYSISEVLFRVNLGLDYPFYENIAIIEHPYELLVLVNKYNQLPEQFAQYNLISLDKKYHLKDGKEYLLAGVACENYLQMWDAAKKEGLSMIVVSAYRTEDYQRNLYNSRLRSSGIVYADNYSARAGHSEHQTGLAIDIGSTSTSFEYSAEFKWLQKHAHEYGFILRYPKGKEWITGYAYEPWHYRFVGIDAAKIIYDEGITFEEYCSKYINVNEFR